MKTNQLLVLALLIIVMQHALGQETIESKVHKRMRKSPDSVFDLREIPEKWRNESAVIIATRVEYEYKKQLLANKFNCDFYLRKRILLKDKAAVEHFSEFSFSQLGARTFNRDGVFLNVKIIKPDGTEHFVNTSEAVRMSQQSGAYRSRTKASYSKLAITNLEVGDIIDFYYVIIRTLVPVKELGGSWLEFDPVIMNLTEEYPILNGSLSFLLDQKTYINLSAVNGVSEPVHSRKEDKDLYTINYSYLEKSSGKEWSFPLRQEPAVRFKVVYNTTTGGIQSRNFLGIPGRVKTKVQQSEYLKLMNNNYVSAGIKPPAYSQAVKYVKRNQLENNIDILPKELFYFLRHYLYFNSFKYYGMYVPNYYAIDDYEFIKVFSQLLTRYKIDHELILGMNKSLGSIEQAVFPNEITPGIKIDENGNTTYIFMPGLHTCYGEIPLFLTNSRIIKKADYASNNSHIAFDSIISKDAKNNSETRNITVTFKTDSVQQVVIEENIVLEGQSKNTINNFLIMDSDFLSQEFNSMSQKFKMSKTDFQSFTTQLSNVNVKDDFIKRKENYQEYLKTVNSFTEVKLDTVFIINTGRYSINNLFEYGSSYQTPDLVSIAGDYIIVEAGKLLGRHIEIEERNRQRTLDIYLDYPKTYTWNIDIKIPEGYTAENTDHMNISLENQTGIFSGKASVEEEYIRLNVEKIYKTDFLPISLWPDLLMMLDEANRYTEQKIVLVKK